MVSGTDVVLTMLNEASHGGLRSTVRLRIDAGYPCRAGELQRGGAIAIEVATHADPAASTRQDGCVAVIPMGQGEQLAARHIDDCQSSRQAVLRSCQDYGTALPWRITWLRIAPRARFRPSGERPCHDQGPRQIPAALAEQTCAGVLRLCRLEPSGILQPRVKDRNDFDVIRSRPRRLVSLSPDVRRKV